MLGNIQKLKHEFKMKCKLKCKFDLSNFLGVLDFDVHNRTPRKSVDWINTNLCLSFNK